jgi:hypothetical protein
MGSRGFAANGPFEDGYEDVFIREKGKVRRLVRATANVGIQCVHTPVQLIGEEKQR